MKFYAYCARWISPIKLSSRFTQIFVRFLGCPFSIFVILSVQYKKQKQSSKKKVITERTEIDIQDDVNRYYLSSAVKKNLLKCFSVSPFLTMVGGLGLFSVDGLWEMNYWI